MITSTHWEQRCVTAAAASKTSGMGVCVCVRAYLEDGERKEDAREGLWESGGGGARRGGRIRWLEGWRGEVLRREREEIGQTRRQGDGRRKMENREAVKDM